MSKNESSPKKKSPLENLIEDFNKVKNIYDGVKDIYNEVKSVYGIIHKKEPAQINGKTGYLIWDYIVYNEITFKSDDGEIERFFQSGSDKETEEKWKELVEKYGIKDNA